MKYYNDKQQRNKNKISNVNFVDTLILAHKLKEIQDHMYTTVNTMTYTYVEYFIKLFTSRLYTFAGLYNLYLLEAITFYYSI